MMPTAEVEALVEQLHRKNMMVDDGCRDVAPIFPTFAADWTPRYRESLIRDAEAILGRKRGSSSNG
jgi:hypothetical protein